MQRSTPIFALLAVLFVTGPVQAQNASQSQQSNTNDTQWSADSLAARCRELFDNKKYGAAFDDELGYRVRTYTFTVIDDRKIRFGTASQPACEIRYSYWLPTREGGGTMTFIGDRAYAAFKDMPGAYWRLYPQPDGRLLLKARYRNPGETHLRDVETPFVPVRD